MKYRLTRDDGVEIDVSSVQWEAVLARAYRQGWRPSGTQAPGERTGGAEGPARSQGRRADMDYFSARSQYVLAADALELGSAWLRGIKASKDPEEPQALRREAGERRIAAFARMGGFVIGRAPDALADGSR